MRDEFFREVGEAIRFGKQRSRNVIKRIQEKEKGRRQRLRQEAEKHLLGKQQEEEYNAVSTDDENDADDADN